MRQTRCLYWGRTLPKVAVLSGFPTFISSAALPAFSQQLVRPRRYVVTARITRHECAAGAAGPGRSSNVLITAVRPEEGKCSVRGARRHHVLSPNAPCLSATTTPVTIQRHAFL
jgi:hypothetical protein